MIRHNLRMCFNWPTRTKPPRRSTPFRPGSPPRSRPRPPAVPRSRPARPGTTLARRSRARRSGDHHDLTPRAGARSRPQGKAAERAPQGHHQRLSKLLAWPVARPCCSREGRSPRPTTGSIRLPACMTFCLTGQPPRTMACGAS